MDCSRVSEFEGSRVIEFPYSEITIIGNGKPGVNSYEGIIVRKDWPRFLKVLKMGFVNIPRIIKDNPSIWWLKNHQGFHKDMRDIEAGISFHYVKPEEWQHEPTVTDSFYGIVEYTDVATPSDILKADNLGDDLVRSNTSMVSINNQLLVLGQPLRIHRAAYLSFPINNIRTIPAQGLEKVVLDRTMTENEKANTLFSF